MNSFRNKFTGLPANDIALVKANADSPIAVCLATIEVALAKPIPEIDAARSALSKLERELHEPTSSKFDLAMPLSLTDISPRTINTLETRGIFTVGELLSKQPEELLMIPNFGLRTLTHVRMVMREMGFGMEQESTETEANKPC